MEKMEESLGEGEQDVDVTSMADNRIDDYRSLSRTHKDVRLQMGCSVKVLIATVILTEKSQSVNCFLIKK